MIYALHYVACFFSPDSLKMFSCHIPFLSCASPIHTCVHCVINMKLIYIFQVSAYAGTTPSWIYIGAIKDPRVEIKSCCGQMPMPPGTWCQPAIYMRVPQPLYRLANNGPFSYRLANNGIFLLNIEFQYVNEYRINMKY